ncbi:hypothetical protein MTO96_016165 [Rhipicephalus appendiculatus]
MQRACLGRLLAPKKGSVGHVRGGTCASMRHRLWLFCDVTRALVLQPYAKAQRLHIGKSAAECGFVTAQVGSEIVEILMGRCLEKSSISPERLDDFGSQVYLSLEAPRNLGSV